MSTLSISWPQTSKTGSPSLRGRILHRLLEKLEAMNAALEGRVFDVIGEVLSLNDVNHPEMLREAAYDPRRLEEYLDQIDRIDPAKLQQYEEATRIALARSHVDFTAFQQRNLEVEERRLMPRYVEAQVHRRGQRGRAARGAEGGRTVAHRARARRPTVGPALGQG